MAGHLRSAVPGQRSVKLLWQALGVPDQRVDRCHGTASVDFDQHDLARLPFDQRGDLTVLVAKQQTSSSVTEHDAIFNDRRPLTDRNGAGDPAVVVRFLRVVTRRPIAQVRRRCARTFSGHRGTGCIACGRGFRAAPDSSYRWYNGA